VRSWDAAEAAGWSAPACLGWPHAQYKSVVALAGSFRHDGDAAGLLERFGAISAMRGLHYWSVTDKAWRVLLTDAAALAGPTENLRRPDFTAAEMAPGQDLYFEQTDTRSSSPVVYRMRVLERTDTRFSVETENVSAVQTFLITLFPPGSLRASYFVERGAGDLWSFYGLSSTSSEASVLTSASPASYVNRIAALYRHFIGVPPERELPLAP
jgi:uncharacterized protein DUF6675